MFLRGIITAGHCRPVRRAPTSPKYRFYHSREECSIHRSERRAETAAKARIQIPGDFAMALTESTMELELGSEAPDFALRDVVTGKTVKREDFRGGNGLLVMFICTHCPFVKHVEKGLAGLGMDYDGEPMSIVAISSNDAETYPDDSPEGLKQQAQRLGFRFPYVYDESQNVARAYHAACTPDFFLFDGNLKLVYRG